MKQPSQTQLRGKEYARDNLTHLLVDKAEAYDRIGLDEESIAQAFEEALARFRKRENK